jgi:hypothetical protein
LTVPPQQRVRRDDRFELEQSLAADRLRMPGQQSAFGVGENHSPSTETRLEHSILGFWGIRQLTLAVARA